MVPRGTKFGRRMAGKGAPRGRALVGRQLARRGRVTAGREVGSQGRGSQGRGAGPSKRRAVELTTKRQKINAEHAAWAVVAMAVMTTTVEVEIEQMPCGGSQEQQGSEDEDDDVVITAVVRGKKRKRQTELTEFRGKVYDDMG